MKYVLAFILALGFWGPINGQAEEYGGPAQQSLKSTTSSNWTITTSVNYSTGDYGTGTTTDTLYLPFTLQRNLSQGDIFFTIPYIDQKNGSNDVRPIGGRPFRVGRTTSANTGWEGGIGDLLLGGDYYILQESTQPLDLAAFGVIKFPTADKNKGLGTGEFDETIGLKGVKSFGPHWSALGSIGYTFIGDPSGLNLKNQFFYTLGAGYQWTSQLFTSLSYEEKTKLASGQANPRDLVLAINYNLSEQWQIFGNLGAGLSDGSPDFLATIGTSLLF